MSNCLLIVLFSIALIAQSQQIRKTLQSLQFPLDSTINPANINEFGGSIPDARVHHTLTVSDNYILAYGGYRADGTLINTIDLFDKETQQWSGAISREACCDSEGNVINLLGNLIDAYVVTNAYV